MPFYNAYNLVISSGTALSNIVELNTNEIPVALELPSTWTSAIITLLGSFTGTPKSTYQDGSEYRISGIVDTRAVLNPTTVLGARRLQVRSGVHGSTINQQSNRTIILITAEL